MLYLLRQLIAVQLKYSILCIRITRESIQFFLQTIKYAIYVYKKAHRYLFPFLSHVNVYTSCVRPIDMERK